MHSITKDLCDRIPPLIWASTSQSKPSFRTHTYAVCTNVSDYVCDVLLYEIENWLWGWELASRFADLVAHGCSLLLTFRESSASSSGTELDGEGVADLLPGGDGELLLPLLTGFPHNPSWVFRCDFFTAASEPWWWPMLDWHLDLRTSRWGWPYLDSESTICCIWFQKMQKIFQL